MSTISAMLQCAKINARQDKNIYSQWPFVDIPCDTPNGGKGGPDTWVQLNSQPISTTKRMDGSRNDLSIKTCRGGITSGSNHVPFTHMHDSFTSQLAFQLYEVFCTKYDINHIIYTVEYYWYLITFPNPAYVMWLSKSEQTGTRELFVHFCDMTYLWGQIADACNISVWG